MTVRSLAVGRRPLGDGAAALVAVAAVLGALRPVALPVAVAVAALVGAVLVARPVGLVLAVGLLAATLSHQAWDGLRPLPPAPFEGIVELVSDPVPSFGGWRADARSDVGRVEVTARGGAGGRLGSRRAGARIEVVGRLTPIARPELAATRHVRAALAADTVEPVDDGAPWARAIRLLRSLVTDGARSIPAGQRALFTGFVLGDDRGTPPEVADDFDGAGLAHLLVVSGQNVAFVVAVAAPLLGRLRLRARVPATLALLLAFAAVTRFEPSVLRATVMAGVATVAAGLGRPVGAVRVLALAVTGLVLVDPLLVTSLGFRLSAAASLGIVVLARPIAAVLPGPRPVVAVASVTLAAQAAVAPLLVPAFGPLPVASLPANVLAEPVAGLVMMWGCTAGVVAGLVPAPVAALVHLPTRAGLWWVATVARVGAAAPLGRVGLAGVVAVAGGLGLAVALARRRLRPARVLAGAVVGALLLVPRPPTGPGTVLGTDVGGASLSVAAGTAVLVVPGDARADAVLAGLREKGVRSLDLVVLRSPGATAAATLATVRRRIDVRSVWAPRGSAAPGAVTPPAGPVEAGGLVVTARVSDGRVEVEVETAGRSP